MPDVPSELIASILMDETEGTGWADRISKYLCGGNLAIPVTLNKQPTTLTQLHEDIKKMKKKKIKKITVTQVNNSQTNCIQALNVTIEKNKGLFGIF